MSSSPTPNLTPSAETQATHDSATAPSQDAPKVTSVGMVIYRALKLAPGVSDHLRAFRGYKLIKDKGEPEFEEGFDHTPRYLDTPS